MEYKNADIRNDMQHLKSRAEEPDVVIAGAGPVGMSLAIELATRGVPCTVLEVRQERQTFPARTNFTNARSMTHFRRWGIAENMRLNDPIPSTFARDVTFVTRLNGRVLLNMPGCCEWPEQLPIAPERPEWAPNQAIEKTLHDRIDSLPDVKVQWATRVVDFAQDDEGVDVYYERDDGPGEIRAQYLVIADGSRSRLRKKLNVSLHGRKLASSGGWLIHAPELITHFHTPVSSFVWFFNEDRFCDILIPQSADGHWLYTSSPLPEGVDGDDWESMKQMLFKSVGAEFPVTPVSGGAYATHARMAARYDYGRVFLAGDAAHLTSSKGGFGMNMGIGDAVDIGWKLAARLQGWGGPRLLETYTVERQEAAKFIIDGSTYNQSTLAREIVQPYIEQPGEAGDAARAETARVIAMEKTQEFASYGAQLGYRYETSSLIVRDGTEEPPPQYGDYTPSARPGGLAPHLWLDETTSLYDLFGQGFTLLRFKDIDVTELEAAASALRMPLKVLDIRMPGAADLYAAKLALVRPDQHVAWRSDGLPSDCLWLLDTVRGAQGTRRGVAPAHTHEAGIDGPTSPVPLENVGA